MDGSYKLRFRSKQRKGIIEMKRYDELLVKNRNRFQTMSTKKIDAATAERYNRIRYSISSAAGICVIIAIVTRSMILHCGHS